MMKRVLSFLLCLIMVVGLAAPSVQASSIGNSSSPDILDGIYIPEGSEGTVIVNGEDVTEEVKDNAFDNLPSPGEMTTPTTAPSTPVVVDWCKCVDLSTAEDHAGVCKVKAPYMQACEASADELCALWGIYTAEEQAFMLQYLQDNASVKYDCLMMLLSAPTGSASETYVDGTTVSVEGIPQDGSLTIGEATDEVKDIVDAYVAVNESASTELFTYDVSVQDGDGADWQPDAMVKMELELPGEKLHKYSKVYVVHVDDNGVATTIEAEVTEDGKIAFETPGFSTFAGFTVDFDYEGVVFRIPGMSSIKLSELIDKLKMPLNAEDVVNVEYTDNTQLKIEQLEGDWLLTSLKAFTTEEKLTLTMADGTVYQIKVTDNISGNRADCYFYSYTTGDISCRLDVNYYYEENNNGVMSVFLKDNKGTPTTNDDISGAYDDYDHWKNDRLVFDGNGYYNGTYGTPTSDGAFEVVIEKASNASGNNFKLAVRNWLITDGAIVNVYLFGFDSNDVITFESWKASEPMFTVDDGTLYFNVDNSVFPKDTSTTSGNAHNFHATSCSYKEIVFDAWNNGTGADDAIFFVDDNADNLYVNDAKFVNSAYRAVYIWANEMQNCRLDNCIFDSTIKSTNGGGGAIYISDKTSAGTSNVEVYNLTLNNCEFNQNTITSTDNKVYRGGAVLIWGNLNQTTFYGCKFKQTHSSAQGGAVSIGDHAYTYNQGDITFEKCEFNGTYNGASLAGAVLIAQYANIVTFKDTTFTDVSATGHGGAIHIGSTDDTAVPIAKLDIIDCNFTRCSAGGGRGGALRLITSSTVPVTIKGTTFDGCTASSLGGALSFQGNLGSLTIDKSETKESKFLNCTAGTQGGAISFHLPYTLMVNSVSISNTSFDTCKSTTSSGGAIWHSMWTNDFDLTDCSFTGCEAYIYGGAMDLIGKTGTSDIIGCSFTNCKAGEVGASPIYEKDADGNPTTTQMKDKKGNPMYNGTGGGGALCIAENHGAIRIAGTKTGSTINYSTFSNCESLNNGGAIALEGSQTNTYNITNLTLEYISIDGCQARDSGTAVCFGSLNIRTMDIKNSKIENCSYISKYTDTEVLKNTLYPEDIKADLPYDQIAFRSDDSSGTIRTVGGFKSVTTVENVRFYNNTSATGGGGIYWNANRVSDNVNPKDNAPSTFSCSLTIKNCEFESNQGLRDGGAIYVEASLEVQGSTFKYNKAERGGAIAQQIYNNSGREIVAGESNNLTIVKDESGNGALFEENYAKNHGGAISIRCNATASIKENVTLAYPITFTLTGATVKNNRASENGGGIFFHQLNYGASTDPNQKEVENYIKSCVLDGSTISGNSAGCGWNTTTRLPNTVSTANGSGHGGGIYLEAEKNTTLQVLGCSVYSNTAHYGNGGGVYMSGEGGVCQIKSNAAGLTTEIGGAANKGNKATSSAPGTTAGQNTGNGGGIGIFIKGRIEMQGGTVSYNTADTSGGGIAVNGSTMEFTDGTVTNNAAKYGGGISLTNSGDPTTIADQSLKNPPALTPAWGMVFTNGTVTYNLADIGGGICISNNSTMKLDGGKVWDNQAATKSDNAYFYADGQNGGGIAVVAGSKMNVYAGEVKRNHARNGGGITVQGGSSLQMLPKVGSTAAGTVSNNTAHSNNTDYQGCGGGIYLAAKADSSAKNTLYVDHGTISSNTARYGGGIALMQNAEATLQGGSIDHNEGTDPDYSLGGGAYVYGGKLTISGAELSYNYGQNSGGAVYLRTTSGSIPSELSVTGGTIHHNHTRTGWGAGIYMLGQGCVTTVSGGKIYENYTEVSGSNGGGINAEHNCTLNINGGEIYSNRAASNGGGINAHSSAVINIDGGAIYKNTAIAGTGGGIYAYSSTTMTITGGDIYSNKAATHGGGMHVSSYSTLTFNGGDVRDNTAGRGGGGIAVSWHSNATVSTSADGKKIGKIMNNTAAMGGGLYVECSDLTVRNGYIINNKAVGQPASDVKTAYHLDGKYMGGIGGGICLTGASGAKGTFTLTGDKIAIYGNTADFAADDVCSNGQHTQLDIPTVVQMDLADYDFQAEGWVEDYCKDDSKYNLGLNMINLHADRAEAVDNPNADAIRNMGVARFRNTPSTNRKYMLVEPEYVSGKNPNNTAVSGVYANQANAYVCLTLGIPGAADDTVVLDYGTTVNVNLIDNDLFVNEEDFRYGELGLGIPNGVNEKYGIHYSSAKNANGTAVDHLGTFYGTKLWNDKLSNGAAFLNSNTGIITYNYNYGNGQLSFKETETFAYTVKHGTSWFYAKITVVPATTIYYEDTVAQVKYHTESSKESLATWETIGQSLGTAQDQDRPGEALIGSLDADSIYGYDSKRGSTTAYSDGGAHLVTVSHEHNAEDGNNDGFCDKCNHALLHDWVDIKIEEGSKTTDKLCDVCGAKSHISHADTCNDINKNWFCDFCGKRVGRGDNNARASFTFTGTGFDIISYCSAKTGIVMATVYKGEVNVDTIADNDAEFGKRYVASYIVDTYYGYKQDSNGKWVLDAESTDTLYQVPVIKADLTKVVVVQDDHNTKDVDETEYKNYGYGTYTVELYVAPSFLEREAGYWGADFYLDAIRIYNPAGDESGIYVTDEPKLDKNGKIIRDQYGQPVFKTTTVDNSAVRDVHKADKEGWPVYTELRNMFISQKNLGVTTTEGIIFIDGKTETSVADYSSWGPNNEVYLNPQQHIAFTLDMQGCTNVDAIHIGMRGLTGKSGVTIAYGTSVNDAYLVLTQNLSTTDMYYSISMKDSKGNFRLADKVVVITNSGSKPIAISNIKVTHSAAPTYQTAKMKFKVSKQTAEIALGILNAQQLSEPTVTPKYPALSYNGMICYNVFFSAEDLGSLTADDLGLAVFDSYDPEGTVETARDVIMGATQIDGLYMVATKGVNAKYLGDTQYFRAFAKKADGSFVYSKMVSYSAVDYAKNVLAKSNDVKLKQLAVAMLNYGAEAQTFFGYKTDDLMNKDLTADDQALLAGFDASSLNGVQKVDPAKVGAFASTGGFTRRSPAISFNGAFEINYFFTPAHAPDGDMVLYFWNEDTYNSVTELTYDNADKIVEVSTKDGTYTATSDEIIARQLDQTLYVAAVYRSYGETYCSGVLPYSIAAYCQKPPAGVQALATAAAVYGCTAKQFFGE